MQCFSIESCIRVYKGIWEASIGEELPYCCGNGEVQVSLSFSFNIAFAFFDHSMLGGLIVTEDPVDLGHCQRDTSTIESYSESRLST